LSKLFRWTTLSFFLTTPTLHKVGAEITASAR
jgi:hypothetical protein